MSKQKTEEVLVRIEEHQLLPPKEDKPFTLVAKCQVLTGRLEGETVEFWGKWGSPGEQKRVMSACTIMGMDPEADLEEPTGLGTVRLANAVIRPNDQKEGKMEVWFFKEAKAESEYI
jgi:hypothetical protein